MAEQKTALEDNATWSITDLFPWNKAIGCKWNYKIKHNAEGTIERFKAWFVALGNQKEESLDYNKIFSPDSKLKTIQTFLLLAGGRNWELHQMEVHNTFLHGKLDECI